MLADGQWGAMAIAEEGIYKIGLSDLQAMGINPAGIDPTKIKVFGTGGMLIQQLDGSNPIDPQELSIYVEGEGDGSFDNNDYVLFYARGAHILEPDVNSRKFIPLRNYYNDTAYYYLQVADTPGKRLGSSLDQGGSPPMISTYDYPIYLEEDLNTLIGSGREWMGDRYSAATPVRTYSFIVPGVSENSDITISPQMLGYSFLPTQFDFSLNGLETGSLAIPSVDDFLYDEKGNIVSGDFTLSSALLSGDEYTLDVEFIPATQSRISEGYLDHLILQFERDLELTGDQLIFRTFESMDQPVTKYQVDAGPDVRVWDITDPLNTDSQDFTINGQNIEWSSSSGTLRHFVVFDPLAELLKPVTISALQNQDVKGNPTPDLIVVTYPGFESQAEQLAQHRRTYNALDVLVVTTDQVFTEFSYGAKDPTAIRNMAYHFYHIEPGKLKHLLLFGRGSYDFKNIRRGGKNYVPIYQSRESLDPLETYSSDDYYGFLEDGEGAWIENSAGNHSMDISVGRIPLTNQQEASDVVNKLIRYDTSPDTYGSWRKKLLFIADDGDFNIHNSQSDQLTQFVDTTFQRYDPLKLFLDNFEQEPRAGGEKSPAMTEAIDRAIEEGALIANYTGHGGEAGWAQEFVLDQFKAAEWDNGNRLPLLVTATCEFGRHDNPDRISTGEMVLLNPEGGAIGLVSTSRPVFSSTNFQLNKAFYQVVFEESMEGGLSLGEIFRQTKNSSLNGVFNRNFSLLGDPSMKLSFPKYKIEVVEINQAPPESDTLSALSEVTIRGEVVDYNGNLVAGFNGGMELTLYDKQRQLTTLGDENPPFIYKDWSNRLFNGMVSVVNGQFEVNFILPKNLIYSVGNGKISMYALDTLVGTDASGTLLKLKVGGQEESPGSDVQPPEIEVFLNDESFLNGSTVPSDSRLIVNLSDESGINISGLGVGQKLEAVLDGVTYFDLNNYYTSNLDDFTSGRVEFDLFDLEEGEHEIKVTAWDNQNNYAESKVQFTVSDNPGLEIYRVIGAPNPFRDQTVISVEHNRPGEDLQVNLRIYDRMGQQVWLQDYLFEASPIRIKLLPWQAMTQDGQKIEQGIYIVEVIIRSLRDGSKNKSYAKLINLN